MIDPAPSSDMGDEAGALDVEYTPRTFDSATTAEERLAVAEEFVAGSSEYEVDKEACDWLVDTARAAIDARTALARDDLIAAKVALDVALDYLPPPRKPRRKRTKTESQR
jgi:hypothetical protein